MCHFRKRKEPDKTSASRRIRLLVVVVVVVAAVVISHIQRIGYQPEKNNLHGG